MNERAEHLPTAFDTLDITDSIVRFCMDGAAFCNRFGSKMISLMEFSWQIRKSNTDSPSRSPNCAATALPRATRIQQFGSWLPKETVTSPSCFSSPKEIMNCENEPSW